MSILDLANSSKILNEWISNESVEGEIDPVIDELWNELEGAIQDKAEVYCRIIREFELISNARLEESSRIRQLAMTDMNKVKAMKNRLMYFFEMQGISKLDTYIHTYQHTYKHTNKQTHKHLRKQTNTQTHQPVNKPLSTGKQIGRAHV